MTVYEYIAENNGIKANEFCVNNGFNDACNTEELSNNLMAVVAQNGELSLKKVMELHPDKDVLVELFQPKNQIENIKEIVRPPMMMSSGAYMNATGNTVATSKETNTMILIAALIISVAVVSISK